MLTLYELHFYSTMGFALPIWQLPSSLGVTAERIAPTRVTSCAAQMITFKEYQPTLVELNRAPLSSYALLCRARCVCRPESWPTLNSCPAIMAQSQIEPQVNAGSGRKLMHKIRGILPYLIRMK